MTYEHDLILPLIETEVQERLQKFKGLTAEEESNLLMLSADQKTIVADNDRKLKNEFLRQAPTINHGTVKNNEKFTSYMTMVATATK